MSNTRPGSRLNVLWRRRRCQACGRQFTTYESADPGSILRIRKTNALQPFSHTMLLMELVRACDHREDADEAIPYLAATIEQKLYRACAENEAHSVTIPGLLTAIAGTLQPYDPVAYVKFISRHQKNIDAPTLRRALKRKTK